MKPRNKKQLFIEAFPLLGDNPSGIGKLLYSMITALLKNEAFRDAYDVTLVVSLGKRHRLDKWQFDNRVTVKELPLPLRVINVLDRLNLMFPIDLVCGRGVYLFPNYRRLPLARSGSLTYVHDMSYMLFPDTVQERNLSFLRKMIPRSMRRSDRILTLSRQAYDELQVAYPQYSDKIDIIPAGVDKEVYAYRNDADETRAKLAASGVVPGKYLLFVGNIEPRKNLDYLLDVYVELHKNQAYSDLSLLLVGGDGWRSDETVRKIDTLNERGYSIIRPKKRVPDDDLPALYHESLAAMLLSVYEGFGMTPLEALSAGARVIVSDIPVLREVGGDAVTYVPLGNAADAAKMVDDAIHRTIDGRAVATQLALFTWDAAAVKLMRSIDKVVEQKG